MTACDMDRRQGGICMGYPIIPSKIPAPGWVGGFSSSNPKFAYPHPDLSPLPLLHNMDNIPLLDRQLSSTCCGRNSAGGR
jgi:hypothetical protein